MIRRFFLHNHPDETSLKIFVTFDDRFFWKATFSPKSNGGADLDHYTTGMIKGSPLLADDFHEVAEQDFWEGAHRNGGFIRWALSAYYIYLTRMSLPYSEK